MKPIVGAAVPPAASWDLATDTSSKTLNISGTADLEVTPDAAPGFAYNPYHYIQFGTADNNGIVDFDKAIAAAPHATGIMIRPYWKDLESSSGVYTFTFLRSVLDWCDSNGKHLVVMPIDKTFANGDGTTHPLPSYLSAYEVTNTGGGYTAIRWDATVVTRYKALLAAIANEVQTYSSGSKYQWFEGIATQETALSLTSSQYASLNYIPADYADTYIDIFDTAYGYFPDRRLFWFSNFIPSRTISGVSYPGGPQIDRVVSESYAAHANICFGGPDYWPLSAAGDSLRTNFYPKLRANKDVLPLFIGFSPPSYQQGITMQALFDMCVPDIFPNFIFSRYVVGTTGKNFINDMAPVIENDPTFNSESWSSGTDLLADSLISIRTDAGDAITV
jgi:hypothetical protein